MPFLSDLNKKEPVRRIWMMSMPQTELGLLSELGAFGSRGGGAMIAAQNIAQEQYTEALKTDPTLSKPEILRAKERAAQISAEREIVGKKTINIGTAEKPIMVETVVRRAETEGGPTIFLADRDRPEYWQLIKQGGASVDPVTGEPIASKTVAATILKYGSTPTSNDPPKVWEAYLKAQTMPDTREGPPAGGGDWLSDPNNQLLLVGLMIAIGAIFGVVFVSKKAQESRS